MDADSVWRPVEQPVTVTDADAEAADLDADEIEAAERKMRQLTLQPSDTACKFRNRRSEMYVETKELPGFFSFRAIMMTLSRFFSSSCLRYYFVAGAPNVKQMRAFDLYVDPTHPPVSPSSTTQQQYKFYFKERREGDLCNSADFSLANLQGDSGVDLGMMRCSYVLAPFNTVRTMMYHCHAR